MRLMGRFPVSSFPFGRYLPHFIVSSVILAAIATASGCGSGSGNPKDNNATPSPSSSATATPTPSASATPSTRVTVTARVIWGPRSRQTNVQNNAVGGPSSALSATLTLTPLNSSTPVLTLNVERGTLNGAQDYTSGSQQIAPGIYSLKAVFYAQSGQQGAVVGNAQASATVLGTGMLSTTIATVGTIQKVVLTTGTGANGLQEVRVGQTVTIGYSALDSAGNVVVVTPGSAFVNVIPNTLSTGVQDTVTRATASAESVTGVTPNRATVIVSVDGVNSAPTQIAVRSFASIVVTPPGTPVSTVTVGLGQARTFTAAVANDGPTGLNGVYWQVLKNGAIDTAQTAGTVTSGGPSFQTTFTATGALANVSSATNVYVLRAVSAFDTDVYFDVPLNIVSLISVTPTPASATVSINQTINLSAVVNLLPTGALTDVTYTVVTTNGGTVTSDGVYTAPGTPSPAGSPYIVRITSQFDTTKFVDVPITVQSGNLTVGVQ